MRASITINLSFRSQSNRVCKSRGLSFHRLYLRGYRNRAWRSPAGPFKKNAAAGGWSRPEEDFHEETRSYRKPVRGLDLCNH